ncbi:MAG TPA: TonB-dependent receptor, partial [Erythrobacter sp.]|nr:TonB-dependent receptor [Erythrobacter sp.]
FGDVTLTSITGYREYSNFQGSDTDYTQVDLLYRAPGPDAGAREFKTFTQEFRLNGTAFNDTLDWLIGAYYANEKLETRDNLRFGNDYGTFANCRIALAINPALANPSADNCLGANVAALDGTLTGTPAFGPATPLIIAGINNLAQVRDIGSNGDRYNQTSENFAVFTHNIVHVTDTVDLTLGLRYTNETKDFDAAFSNDNVFCPQSRA